MTMETGPTGQFPPSRRLRKRSEYLAVQSCGRRFHSPMFVIRALPSALGRNQPGRLGITVSKRVGSAVRRNRVRRLVREFVRISDWIPPGMDVVVIAKRSAARASGLDDVRQDLESVGGLT